MIQKAFTHHDGGEDHDVHPDGGDVENFLELWCQKRASGRPGTLEAHETNKGLKVLQRPRKQNNSVKTWVFVERVINHVPVSPVDPFRTAA